MAAEITVMTKVTGEEMTEVGATIQDATIGTAETTGGTGDDPRRSTLQVPCLLKIKSRVQCTDNTIICL